MLKLRIIMGMSIALAIIVGSPASLALSQPNSATPHSQPISAHDQCIMEPRTWDELAALAETVEATPDDDSSIDFITTMPSGTSADAATVTVVTVLVNGLTACASDGDTLRFFAHYTDDYLRVIAGAEDAFIENLQATPVNEWSMNPNLNVVAIQDVLLLDDGRVSAIVTLGGVEDNHPAPGRTVLMIFAEVDDRWLLDGQYERVWTGDPTTAPVEIADLVAIPEDEPGTPHS